MSGYVKLVSAEGHEFFVHRECANVSQTIGAMLSGSFAESKEGSATFPEISTEILEKVIQYFHYKQRYQNSREPVPEFPVNPEQALALLMASNFLDC